MKTINSTNNLQRRVLDFLFEKNKIINNQHAKYLHENKISTPASSLSNFLNQMTAALPEGDVYLFGGFLRDIAIQGRRNFSSDVDIVIEGDWNRCIRYLDKLGASKNKFGGYRHAIAHQDIDIWHAPETWAIKHQRVKYENISSLLKTTILNWDAILMNWRTKNILMNIEYIDDIRERHLDIVLTDNPDPIGMAVRVFRQISKKEARTITLKAAIYLAECAKIYNFETLMSRERDSYGLTTISIVDYKYFKENEFIQTKNSNQSFKLNFQTLRNEYIEASLPF
jgi:hypothetical protein